MCLRGIADAENKATTDPGGPRLLGFNRIADLNGPRLREIQNKDETFYKTTTAKSKTAEYKLA
jgi:hypothetical protein